MYYEAFLANVLKEIYRGVVNIFAKTLKLENCYKIVIRVMLRRKIVFEIAESIATKLIWRQHKSSRHMYILVLVSINFVKAKFIFLVHLLLLSED